MAPLYTLHPLSLSTTFAEVETFALGQPESFVGTPGSVLRRRNAADFEFYAHQYYDALGAKRERYLAGPVGSSQAEASASELKTRIADVNRVVALIRLLGREGFQLVESRAFAAIATLHNHGLFAAGALLVGSHAYGVLLNRLGVRAPSYVTEDVDIARPAALALAGRRSESLLDILRESHIEFVEVPQLDARKPATSFKQRGRSTFQVELLAPARGEEIATTAVPELKTDAVALPFLGYLLKESQMTVVLAREGCCAVRVPTAERYAVHKLIVSELRGRESKVQKDRGQALVLCAALGDLYPGALRSAAEAVPRRAVKYLRRGLYHVRDQLESQAPRAWEELAAAGLRR